MSSPPNWLINAAQGLAFWAAHQSHLYENSPLPEGALNVAFTSLVTASKDVTAIQFEQQYRNLGARSLKSQRADFLITDSANPSLRHVIELVRFTGGYGASHQERTRLAKVTNRGQIGWIVVVAQRKRPTQMVSSKGTAWPRTHRYGRAWAVRRVLKAASSFQSTKRAVYVCIVQATTHA
jgi:hypothetical protein